VSFKVIGLGEVLWDLLPAGRQLGGAPANFAYHALALGADARIVSRVGNDENGRDILDQLHRLGLPTDCMEVDDTLPTGTVSVELAADGQPKYRIHENVAWDAIAGDAASRTAVAKADAVCFGTLAQRSAVSREAIRSLVALTPPGALRILDVNLRQDYFSPQMIEESLARVNVLKVNDAELPQLASMLRLDGDVHGQIARLAERFRLRLVACTRGGDGSLLYSDGQWSDSGGAPIKVVDTIGAGDSFTAAMTLGFLAGSSLDRINELANRVAAYVCTCAGATPPLPPALRAAFGAAGRPGPGPSP
jgi:fructokinase